MSANTARRHGVRNTRRSPIPSWKPPESRRCHRSERPSRLTFANAKPSLHIGARSVVSLACLYDKIRLVYLDLDMPERSVACGIRGHVPNRVLDPERVLQIFECIGEGGLFIYRKQV